MAKDNTSYYLVEGTTDMYLNHMIFIGDPLDDELKQGGTARIIDLEEAKDKIGDQKIAIISLSVPKSGIDLLKTSASFANTDLKVISLSMAWNYRQAEMAKDLIQIAIKAFFDKHIGLFVFLNAGTPNIGIEITPEMAIQAPAEDKD